jgi:hypothetical protein
MDALDRGHDTDRRSGDAGEIGDLAADVHAHLEHGGAVLRPEPEQRQRQPPLIVEAPARLQHLPARTEDAGDQLLGGPLAVGAGHPDNRNGESRAVECGEHAEGARRVLDEHQRHVGRDVVVQRVHDQARGAARGRLGEERVAVEPVAPDGEEGLADAERSGVDGHPGDRDAEVTGDQCALGGANDVLHGKWGHVRS